MSPTRASACAGSSAGRMPSSCAHSWNAASASSSVALRYVARPMSLQIGVLGADAGIVEAGADRVAFENLAVFVLQKIGAVAVQHAGAAASDGGGVLDATRRCRGPPLQRRRSSRSRRRGTDGTGRSRSSRRRCRPSPHPAGGLRAPEFARALRGRSRFENRAPFPDRGADRRRCRCNRRCRATLVTQSRSASFIASFSVAAPDVTGRTSAPSSFMRKTLGFCRSMSVAPMNTTHGRPKRAQTVAVATPC